jgi:S-phase kinase-associated protein 1
MYSNQYENSSKNVHLVSQEGESFDVPLSVASMSELVKQMLDEDQLEDEEAQEMPLLNIKSTILAKVIEYCQYYRHNPMNDIEKVRFPVYLTCLLLLLH